MKKKNIVATGAILGFALLLTAGFALPDFKATTKEAMKKKLAHSQLTLEGIAMEKFDIIERNAAALSRLSHPEKRTHLISFASGDVLVNIIPPEIDLEKIEYKTKGKFVTVTDGEKWSMELSEVAWE